MSSDDRSSQSGRVRRLLGRALVVTGTVAAGTGAVWVIGTGLPAHASSLDSAHDQGLLPGVQRDVDGLLDPGAHSGAAEQGATAHSGARHEGGQHERVQHEADQSHEAGQSGSGQSGSVRSDSARPDSARSGAAQPGPEASPLPDLDPGALLHFRGQPEKDVHRNVDHDDVRDESAHQVAAAKSARSAERTGDSTSDGQDRSAPASEPRSADAHEDVLAPVAKTVDGQVLRPVAAPVTGAVDDLAHAVRPVLEPAGKAVAQVGDHPEQLPGAVDAGLTDLGRPLWTDASVPPAPAQPARTAAQPAPSAAPVAAQPAQPRSEKTAPHHGTAPTAHPEPQHPDDHPQAPGHPKLDDLAVPGAPAPTPAPAGGHLPGGDLGLDWCPRVPGPHLPSLGVLGHPRDDAATGTCGSQPGTTPD